MALNIINHFLLRNFALPHPPSPFLPERWERIIAGVYVGTTAGVIGVSLLRAYSANEQQQQGQQQGQQQNQGPSIGTYVFLFNAVTFTLLRQSVSLEYVALTGVTVYVIFSSWLGAPILYAAIGPAVTRMWQMTSTSATATATTAVVTIFLIAAGRGYLNPGPSTEEEEVPSLLHTSASGTSGCATTSDTATASESTTSTDDTPVAALRDVVYEG